MWKKRTQLAASARAHNSNKPCPRTFRRTSCLVTRLLGNMGVQGETPLVERLARPCGEDEQRWMDGFYLDTPEEFDDPYRFFRW